MVDSRQQRVARNEALFREVNERIKEINEEMTDAAGERSDFLCECGDEGCTKAVSMTLSEYEAVREDGKRFAVLRGHEIPDVERVVFQSDRYAVVEKEPPAAARIALETDPRS
jgi:hypothetical protein